MSSFLRYLQVFLRIGRRRLIAAGAAGALSAAIILLAAHGRAGSLNIDATFSLADNIILYFGGNSPYIRRPGLPFTPSVEWLLTLALLLSLQADIPLKNLSGIGKDILARGKSRPAWWGAASAWTLICASVFLGGAFLACLAITGITAAVMDHPRLLVLDEPTNALDEDGVSMLKTILKEERKHGSTVLVASHQSDFLQTVADQILHVREGSVDAEPQRP